MEKDKLLYPFYTLAHPVEGFEQIKYGKKGSFGVSLIILALYFITTILNRQAMAFPFNPFKTDELNIFMLAAQSIVLFLLWVIANWCLCSLIDGEGRMSDIWISTSYALMPVILITIIIVIASHLVTNEEHVFIGMLGGLQQLWFIFLMISAMKEVHQFTLKKTIISMALTIAGMGIIIFLIILIFSLFQQMYIFLYTICSEILFRM